jgi:hypothetical protein
MSVRSDFIDAIDRDDRVDVNLVPASSAHANTSSDKKSPLSDADVKQ